MLTNEILNEVLNIKCDLSIINFLDMVLKKKKKKNRVKSRNSAAKSLFLMFHHGVVHVAVSQLIVRPSYVLMHHMNYRDMTRSDSTAVCGLPNARSNLEANNLFYAV